MILDKVIAKPQVYRNIIRSLTMQKIRLRSDIYKKSTILYLIHLYNKFFFDGLLNGLTIDIRWNKCFSNWIADCSGEKNTITLRFSTKVFSDNIIDAMGYKATHLSKLEIFMLVLEHEMVHGITQIYFPRRYVSKRKGVDDTHNYYFMRTVNRLFGHTSHEVTVD